MIRALAILLLMILPASAQQMTPSQTALAVNQAVAQMAQSIERMQAQISELQKQVQACQAPAKPNGAQ